MCAQFERWVCVPSDLVDLTPVHARDLIIECFSQARYETQRCSPTAADPAADLDAFRREGDRAVRDAFARTGSDFEHPSKASLERVVKALAEESRKASTPVDVVRHHEQQIAMILGELTD
jgi:hypothetical protein